MNLGARGAKRRKHRGRLTVNGLRVPFMLLELTYLRVLTGAKVQWTYLPPRKRRKRRRCRHAPACRKGACPDLRVGWRRKFCSRCGCHYFVRSRRRR